MTKIFFVRLTLFCFLNPTTTFADTVDVWTVKLNGKVIINSNQTDILYFNHPMIINLSSFKDNDTLQICYRTDSFLELFKWYYIFKDSNNVTIDKFTHTVDSSSRKAFYNGKNYISFSVQSLRQLIKSKDIDKIFVEFQQDNLAWSKEYLTKPVCVISNN